MSHRVTRHTNPEMALRNKVFFLFCLIKISILTAAISLNGCAKRKQAETSPQMDAKPPFWVRVLLLDDVNNIRLNLNCSWSISRPGLQKVHFRQPAESFKINIQSGNLTIGELNCDDAEISIEPDSPYIFNINGSDYRGNLRLITNPDGNSFDAVNYVPLEPYLAGVISAEMPSYWEPAALEAQAIASRTYCLFIKRRFGVNRHWDVKKTEAHQVYRGVAAESGQIWKVVNKTAGKVLMCHLEDGSSDIFPAYYSSSCGGHTEDSRNVFGGAAYSPLMGVYCPYCEQTAKSLSLLWPEVTFDTNDISERLLQRYPVLKQLGKIVDIVPVRQSEYHSRKENPQPDIVRLTQIKLAGSSGKFDFVRAEDFRCAIDPEGRKIKSAVFKIKSTDGCWLFYDGRGWGHSVGMCQCGAQAMARMEGKTAEQILLFYYPDSFIEYVY